MGGTNQSNRAATRWTVRLVPVFIVGAFGVATYAVVARLCVQYLYLHRHKPGLTAGFLILYFLFFILTFASYIRVLSAVQIDAGLVPLTNSQQQDLEDVSGEKRQSYRSRRNRDPEENPWTPPDPNPDSPGLEAFYSKDVFACEADGRPKWCSECRQWKPDRAHHSSEMGRCVRKMDHLCPWVGGMVSETSFNFFAQFTFYTSCLCAICLAISIYCLLEQINEVYALDGWIIGILVLAAFFGLFAFGMTLTAGRFIFTNTTNIDMLRKRQRFFIAVRIPRDTPPSSRYPTITYPLQPSQGTGPPGPSGQQQDQQDGSAESRQMRDLRATRKFAILQTDSSENPWDLGAWANFKSVMGDNIVEWLLPIKHSPCCSHESMTSDYPFGALIEELRKRYGVPNLVNKTADGIEMHHRRDDGP